MFNEEIARKAVHTVCGHANNANDAENLLLALGLLDEDRQFVIPSFRELKDVIFHPKGV